GDPHLLRLRPQGFEELLERLVGTRGCAQGKKTGGKHGRNGERPSPTSTQHSSPSPPRRPQLAAASAINPMSPSQGRRHTNQSASCEHLRESPVRGAELPGGTK